MYIIYSNHFTPTPASHLWVYTTEVNGHHLSLNSSAAVSPEPFSVRDPDYGWLVLMQIQSRQCGSCGFWKMTFSIFLLSSGYSSLSASSSVMFPGL